MREELQLKAWISIAWFVVCASLLAALYLEWPSPHFALRMTRWVWTAVSLTSLVSLLEALSEWRARQKP